MRSTFFGLEIGRRGIQSQQKALDVTGHNIANANTEGYSRQRAIMEATTPMYYPGYNKPVGAGQIGTGVSVQEIKRVRDSFLDTQIRKEFASGGEWEYRNDILKKLETILNEPSESGLRTALDQFWGSIQTLSTRPEDRSVRANVRQLGIVLADTFNHMNRQLTDLQKDVDKTITIKVEEINVIAQQISDLNKQIVQVESSGDHSNDLRDRRDLLLDQLSQLARVGIQEDTTGAVTVSLGNGLLVTNQMANKLTTQTDPLTGLHSVQWPDGTNISFTSGTMKGLFHSRDVIVESQLTQLNDLASQFISKFNTQHQSGFGLNSSTGNSFFAGTDASDMQVDAAIMSELDNIAAAGGVLPVAPGNNTNALLLAALKHDTTAMGTSTFDDYYRGMAAQLGVDSQAAEKMVNNQQLVLSQLENQRQQISGVSLDEEMTSMIKFQHAYNAAARVVTSVDEMLDTIINRLGVVGR